MVPPFSRYAVMSVARKVWQHVEEGSPVFSIFVFLALNAWRKNAKDLNPLDQSFRMSL